MKRPNSVSLPGVTAVEVSGNKKLGLCSTTYVAQGPGCPRDCRFLGNGCYYEYGPADIIRRRLDSQAGGVTPLALARNEARAVDSLTGRLPLRLHSGGDCRTPGAARLVSAAADRYRARYGQPAFTYAHAWRAIPRHAWGGVSVLASCETPGEVLGANRRGYAAALTVAAFPRGKKAFDAGEGVKALPCPEQAVGGTDCSLCRLCMDDKALLKRGLTIAFAAHGSGAKRVQETLSLLRREAK